MKRSDLSVGQTVWVEFKGNKKRRSSTSYEVSTISSVGNKYFTLSTWPLSKFNIETGWEVSDVVRNGLVWFSFEKYHDHVTKRKLANQIESFVRMGGLVDLNTSQLSSIYEIIKDKL